MTYAMIDDRFDEHPKYVEADWDLEHYGLQACALTYCNRHQTDGKVPSRAVQRFGKGNAKRNQKLAAALVERGFWRRIDGGYEVVGFLDHNPSKAEVEAKRAAAKARKDAWKRNVEGRSAARPDGEGTRSGTRSDDVPEHDQERETDTSTRTRARGPAPLRSSPILSDDPPNPPGGGETLGAKLEQGFALATYAEGVKLGVREATGDPKADHPGFRHHAMPDVMRLVATYCPRDLDDEQARLEWLRDTARRYAIATFAEAKYQSGFAPGKCLNWLVAGSPPSGAKSTFAAAEPPSRSPSRRILSGGGSTP